MVGIYLIPFPFGLSVCYYVICVYIVVVLSSYFYGMAMTGLSVNSGAIFELMDKVFQLSSIAFLRSGRFLLYVTARMLALFTGFVFVESNSLRWCLEHLVDLIL